MFKLNILVSNFINFFFIPISRATSDFVIFDFFFFDFDFYLFFQFSSEFIFNYLINYIGIISLLLIYLLLISNLFSFSLKFYIVNLFMYKRLYSFEKIFIYSFIPNFLKKNENLVFWICNNLLISTFLALFLLVYTYLINFNFNNLFHFDWIYVEDLFLTNFDFFIWISYFFDSINIGFIIDNLSLLMLIIVLSISTLVHYYSVDYMYSDPKLLIFLKYLSGFTIAMLVLITSNNYVFLFMGWEGVGIFSYLLIGFWNTRTLALKASLKAVIVNKIGDVAMLIAIGFMLYYFGTTDFLKLKYLFMYLITNKIDILFLNFYFIKIDIVTLVSFFLFIAAVGKSAQFGLHTWLPDAMEGPTPVSALIHAATMVTAGVYLIVRSSFLFEQTEIIQNLVLVIGAFTALFGSAVACCQYDIKKIIAFSTCSQIGYMFLACGLSAYNVAMFHLFTHAFFKALLFLCAGSVIHSLADEQDIWKMGGLTKFLPITHAGILIGLFSLMGLPFTSGFYSKDSIIELAFVKNTILGYYSFSCAAMGAILTAFYCYWFYFYVFFTNTKVSKNLLENIHESGFFILIVIIILSFLTIFVGFFFKNPLSSPFFCVYFLSTVYVNPINFYIFPNLELSLHLNNLILLESYYENMFWVEEETLWYALWFLHPDEAYAAFLQFISFPFFWVCLLYFKKYLLYIPFIGVFLSRLFFSINQNWFIYCYFFHFLKVDFKPFQYFLKHYVMTTFVIILMLFAPLMDIYIPIIYYIYGNTWTVLYWIWYCLQGKGLVDYLFNLYIVKFILNFSYYICYVELDKGWLEFFLIKSPLILFFSFSRILNKSLRTLVYMFLPGMLFSLLCVCSVIFIVIFIIF